MSEFIEKLKLLNRKERCWVIMNATGAKIDSLEDSFRIRMNKVFSKSGMEIPPGASVFFDYHLDWIIAALKVKLDYFKDGKKIKKFNGLKYSHQDIDMLIAWDSNGINLLFVEAKMDTSWTNKQLSEKIQRIKKTLVGFGAKINFAIMSPQKPSKLTKENEELGDKWVILEHENLIKFSRWGEKMKDKNGEYIKFTSIGKNTQ